MEPGTPVVHPWDTAELRRLLDEQRRARAGRFGVSDGEDGGAIDISVLTRALSGDPATALAAVRDLRPMLERVEAVAVKGARGRGWRWSEIARVLGQSRQAVHRRHAELRAG